MEKRIITPQVDADEAIKRYILNADGVLARTQHPPPRDCFDLGGVEGRAEGALSLRSRQTFFPKVSKVACYLTPLLPPPGARELGGLHQVGAFSITTQLNRRTYLLPPTYLFIHVISPARLHSNIQ